MRKYFCFLVVAIILTGNYANAQDIRRLGPNYFVAGIPSMTFYPVGQECEQWCWAASCQMVLNYHGLYVNQKEIVQRIFGTLVCQGGTDDDIVNALTGWAPDYRGRSSEIHSQAGLIAPSDIVASLAYHWPLIVALSNSDGSGHAEVMTAIYYSVDQYNNPIVDKVVLRNPWYVYDGSQSKQEMSWYEFSNRVRDIFKIWVVRL
jgi:hypothetical protein